MQNSKKEKKISRAQLVVALGGSIVTSALGERLEIKKAAQGTGNSF